MGTVASVNGEVVLVTYRSQETARGVYIAWQVAL